MKNSKNGQNLPKLWMPVPKKPHQSKKVMMPTVSPFQITPLFAVGFLTEAVKSWNVKRETGGLSEPRPGEP